MIPEGEEFERFIHDVCFAQRVVDYSHDAHLMHLFTSSTEATADVVLVHDLFWRLVADVSVREQFKRFRPNRVIVTEVFRDRQFFGYTAIAESVGFRMHRCQFIDSPGGQIAAMEFHRKEPRHAPE